jgi:hypothetical protein
MERSHDTTLSQDGSGRADGGVSRLSLPGSESVQPAGRVMGGESVPLEESRIDRAGYAIANTATIVFTVLAHR